jgi:electron transport complex protein RnfG
LNEETKQPPPPPERPVVAAWRLIVTLAASGTIAGLLLVFVDQATAPAIAAHKARVLKEAIQEVLKGPARYDTLFFHDGSLTALLPEGVNDTKLERIYLGYDANGEKVGYAIAHREAGFQDFIGLIFGYDAKTKKLLGMLVLESKETPGLGDKIYLDERFVSQFDGVEAPLEGAKRGKTSEENPHDIEMITGATISSRAVIRIINHALEDWQPHIEAFER